VTGPADESPNAEAPDDAAETQQRAATLRGASTSHRSKAAASEAVQGSHIGRSLNLEAMHINR
jgi:hypothetical protein